MAVAPRDWPDRTPGRRWMNISLSLRMVGSVMFLVVAALVMSISKCAPFLNWSAAGTRTRIWDSMSYKPDLICYCRVKKERLHWKVKMSRSKNSFSWLRLFLIPITCCGHCPVNPFYIWILRFESYCWMRRNLCVWVVLCVDCNRLNAPVSGLLEIRKFHFLRPLSWSKKY